MQIYTLESDPFYVEIPNFYSSAECDILHYSYMGIQPEIINTSERQCLRRLKLDWTFAHLVYSQLEHYIPVRLDNGQGYQYRYGMNGRFAHVLTSTGQQFKSHMDGSYRTPRGEKETRLSWLVYLSTPKKGATCFHNVYGTIVHKCEAEKGKAVIFSHKMQHSGEIVDGCKATLRGDIFYS